MYNNYNNNIINYLLYITINTYKYFEIITIYR